MSMNAVFVQVEAKELARIQANPSLAEPLFQQGPLIPPAIANLSNVMQERVQKAGPQMLAAALANLDPTLRKRVEGSLGTTTEDLAAGKGGAELLKVMQERRARMMEMTQKAKGHTMLSLDKEWHGVHYLLCGEVEPGQTLLSNAVLGGAILGDDDEGFSGYGPARCFTQKQVAEMSLALSRSELEAEAANRFDAERMTKLEIYPGWTNADSAQLMVAFRSLRDFYADAAAKGCAIVTCLV